MASTHAVSIRPFDGQRRRRWWSATLVIPLFASLVTVLADVADAAPDTWPPAPKTKITPHTDFPLRREPERTMPVGGEPQAATWPAPGASDVTLAGDGSHQVQGLPITLAATGAAAKSAKPRPVRIQVTDQAAAKRAGVTGVLMSVTPAGPGNGPISLGINYSSFRNAVGANFGSRLRLVSLPACAVSTPDKPECQVQTPIRSSRNDTKTTTVTAELSGTAVVAATGDPSGPNGSFEASSLAPSGSWSVSGNSGGFTWSYPIATPPTAAGSPPSVKLSYSSSSVDGKTASTNNQPSWIGQGWDYTPGYIERTYRPCADDESLPATQQTPDLCWAGQVVTMNLNGSTTALVLDDNTKTWHAESNNGARIELLTGNTNEANNGEHWRVTTQDGVRYHFGLNKPPGHTSQDKTNSTWTVPVYGPKSTDPCYKSSGFADSSCAQAWRWNLDYVENPYGAASVYYYDQETNFYGANKNTTGVAYIRGGTPKRIDYGLRKVNDSIYGGVAAAQIVFGVSERCLPSGAITCDPSQFNEANAKSWPDTPQDQECKQGKTCSNHAPSFWSTKRLTTITTQVNPGTGPVKVDTYQLAQTFPDASDKQLWLSSITRTGYEPGGKSIPLPPVKFTGQLLENRVLGYNQMPAMPHWRVTNIATETGSSINVTYSPTECTATNVPTDLAHNGKRCYPVYWTLPRNTDRTLDYFHKYVTERVQVQDLNGISPSQLTTYTYLGTPAWHFDDNELVKAKYRTYGQFRGYNQVETRTGDPAHNVDSVPDTRTLTRTTYFRGMGGSTPANSLGETQPDNEPYSGMTREAQTFNGDGGPPLSTELTDPITIATTATRNRPGLTPLTATITGTTKTRTRQYLAEGGFRTATTTTRYDNIGRVVATTNSSDGVPDICSTTKYADNTTSWIRTKPSEVITSQQACPAEGVAQTSLLSAVRTYYDNSSTLGALPGTGNPTRVDTATNDTLHFAPTATAVFDTLGRPTATTDALGHTTRLSYTPADGGILAKTVSTSPKGRDSTTEYAPGRGAVSSTVDAAGRRTDATYDALGRLTSLWKPGQTKGSTQASVTYTYLMRTDGPQAVTTKTLIDYGTGTNYVTSIDLYDAFGQLRQTQTDTDNNGRVANDTFYDSHGWVRWTNNRYATTGAPATNLISVAAASVDDRTSTVYDKAGRPVKQTAYKGLTATWDTRTVYGGDRTTTFPPPGGITSTVVTNARGKTTELRQYTSPPVVTGDVVSGGTYQTTTYHYTANDLVDKVTDATGNTWTYGYDFLGRQITQTDPDSGTSTKTYNLAGQVLTATDARKQTIAYQYDELSRKTAEYAESTSGTKLASWVWDTARNGVGKLHYSMRHTTSGNYATGISLYDGQGNPNTLFTSIPASETGLSGFHTTSFTYTTTGLLDTINPAAGGQLPGDITAITYDKLGKPRTMLGYNAYVSSSTYTPFGEPSQYVLGPSNNTATLTYDYDAQTRQLIQSKLSAQQAFPQIDDTRYTYDPAGNITRTVNTQGQPDIAPVRTECFGFDALRRLNKAWTATDNCAASPTTTIVGGPTPYWTSWKFDPNGLRTEQVEHSLTSGKPDTTTTYNYPPTGSPRPHALTGTTSTGNPTTSYDYDAVGNTTTRRLPNGVQTLSWDIYNRLATVTAPGGNTQYTYDADGAQLIRRDPNSTTLFLPGQEFTRNNTTGVVTGTRYYGFNGTTVAIRVGDANPKYVASGLHGTASVTTNSVGFGTTRRTMDPYGNPLGTVQGGPWPTMRGFLDKPTSETTGLTDIGARKYDSATGRFISVDPIFDLTAPQSMNGYAYADNNPLAFSDPTGLKTCDGVGGDWGCGAGEPVHPQVPGSGNGKNRGPSGRGPTCDALCREDRHRWEYAPKTDDAYLLHDYWQTATNLIYGTGWQPSRADRGTRNGHACFMRRGCQMAWLHIAHNPNDVAGAKEIAAMYCVWNFDECAWEATKEDVTTQMMFDVLTSLYGVGGRRYGPGAGTTAKEQAKATARCPGSSFIAGTLVLMADGTHKPIDQLQPGDMVLATDPETGETGPRAVLTPITSEGTKTFTQITIETDGPTGNQTSTLTATDNHPFWAPELRTWIPASELQAGSLLRTSAGTSVQVKAAHALTADQRVHNLTIDDIHTYYVLVGTVPVLVHNQPGAGSPNKGDEGTEKLMAELKSNGYMIRGTEISARAANGRNVRFDIVAEKDGALHMFDAKNGPNAGFTKNQGRLGGYASIETSGGTWYGANAEAAGLRGSFGPHPVKIAGYGNYPYSGRCR